MYGDGRKVALEDVRQAISRTLVPGVRNLTVTVLETGDKFQIGGEADGVAEKANVFRLLTDKLGDSQLVNGISVEAAAE